MALIGLTGGTGSGKSKAARRFAARGIPTIDADKVGHEVIAPDGPAYQAVVDAFGQDILTGGVIDREKLGAVVFSDDAKRLQLNAIVHPLIRGEITTRCAGYFANGHRHVIIDAALLAENGVRDAWLDLLILVSCPPEERQRRLVAYRGLTEEDAARRIAVQTDPETKRDAADWIIDNRGTMDALDKQVDQIAEAIDRVAG